MYEQEDFIRKIAVPLVAFLTLLDAKYSAAAPPATPQERMVAGTIEFRKAYPDPFNDVDVDVIFSQAGQSWRVPTFWRGGQKCRARGVLPTGRTLDAHGV